MQAKQSGNLDTGDRALLADRLEDVSPIPQFHCL
jgi:hypothetical protein